MKHIYIILFLFFTIQNIHSQVNLPPGTYSSVNKKAIKYYEEGKKNYGAHQDEDAEKYLNKCLQEDPNFIEAHSALAYLLMEKRRTKEAISHFQKAVDINPKFFPRNFFDLGLALLLSADYSGAQTNLETYLKFERINPNTKTPNLVSML
jgi:tetratricopeptide (TPR) repeat protein